MPLQNNSIDVAFVEQFEREVHLAYQRTQAQLRPTVRQKAGVVGYRTTFQKMATAAAQQKARNGEVTPNNLVHTTVQLTLSDWYSSELIDKLDELKINHDERSAVATSLAAALARKDDELITTAMTTGTVASSNQTTSTGGLTQVKIEEVYAYFGDNDVPNDGNRWLLVSPAGWIDLMNITEFASQDYIGSDLPYPKIGNIAKRWYSFNIMPFSGLPSPSAGVRSCFAYHSSAVGHASQADISLDITWQGKNQGHLFVASMAAGATEIDAYGLYDIQITE